MDTWLTRACLRAWARSGRGHGWLYQYLDRPSGRWSARPVVRQLANGLRIRLDLRDHVQRQIFFFGAYEPIDLSLFLQLVGRGATVIDAGANIGFHALLLAAHVGPTGRVVAFEPVGDTFARLEANRRLNDLPQLSVRNHALWHRRESLTLSLAETNAGNIGGFSVADTPRPVRQVTCSAVRLDDVVADDALGRVDAIKMDVEGAERFALDGGRATIARDRPVCLLEVCEETCRRAGYDTADLWRFFAGFDYRAYRVGATFGQSGWVSDFAGIRQSNLILVPPDRVEGIGAWDDKTFRRRYV